MLPLREVGVGVQHPVCGRGGQRLDQRVEPDGSRFNDAATDLRPQANCAESPYSRPPQVLSLSSGGESR